MHTINTNAVQKFLYTTLSRSTVVGADFNLILWDLLISIQSYGNMWDRSDTDLNRVSGQYHYIIPHTSDVELEG